MHVYIPPKTVASAWRETNACGWPLLGPSLEDPAENCEAVVVELQFNFDGRPKRPDICTISWGAKSLANLQWLSVSIDLLWIAGASCVPSGTSLDPYYDMFTIWSCNNKCIYSLSWHRFRFLYYFQCCHSHINGSTSSIVWKILCLNIVSQGANGRHLFYICNIRYLCVTAFLFIYLVSVCLSVPRILKYICYGRKKFAYIV